MAVAKTRTKPCRLVAARFGTLLGVFLAGPLAAQSHPPWARLTGSAVDIATGAPIHGVLVVARPDLPRPGAVRAAMTDSLGAYHLDRLHPGRIEIVASIPGYRDLSLAVDLSAGEHARVSLGLTAEPLLLGRLDIAGDRDPPFTRATDGMRHAGPAGSVRDSEDDPAKRAIGTDADALTRQDVERAVTLAEPDVLRALLRLPSTTTRSDYTAELWTRGAPWHQTRLYFDGVPLFGPLHALGMFSGFNTGSVGSLWFYPGVRPASIGDGAAGSVDLGTRPGTGAGELSGEADLSLIGASATLSQQVGGDDVRWMLSGRRTHAGWAARALAPPGHELPYAFWDLTGRLDIPLRRNLRLETSATTQRDRFGDDGEDLARWSAEAARVTAVWSASALEFGTTLGVSRSRGAVAAEPFDAATHAAAAGPLDPSNSALRHISLTGSMRSRTRVGGLARWSAGYEVTRLESEYDGLPPFPLPRAPNVVPNTQSSEPFFDRALSRGALWLEGVANPLDGITAQVGLRMERAAGGAVPGTRVAPRVIVEWQAPAGATVSAAFGRTHQYVQSLAPTGVHVASLSSSDVWLVAGRNVPVLRADLATLGLNLPVLPGWVAGAQIYDRRSEGLLTPDPTPGPLFARPLWVVGSGRARGVEASLMKRSGPWTASAAYAYARSTIAARELRFAAPSERPHAVDVTMRLDAGTRWTLGAAFTAASGVAFTEIHGKLDCDAVDPCLPQSIPWVGAPSGARAPAYASLDLMAEREWDVGRGSIAAFAQLRNALGRDNGTFYTLARPGCVAGACGPRRVLETRYEQGLPRLPVLGLRARF